SSSSRAAAVRAYNRGCAQYAQNCLSDAADSFRQSLSSDPTLFQSYGPLGQILFLRGEFSAALQYLQIAVEHDESNSAHWCQLAVAATRVHNLPLARAAFARYLSLEPRGSYAEEARRCLRLLDSSATAATGANYL